MIRFAALLLTSLFCARGASDNIWIDVPFIRQPKQGCGSASVAMVMQYWRANPESSDAARIHEATYSGGAEGIQASSLQRYLQDHGFRVFAFPATWEDLRAHLSKGRPLIVCLRVKETASRHYVVVAGMTGPFVLLNDPADRKLRRMEQANFDKYWRAAGNWTLLAVPVLNP